MLSINTEKYCQFRDIHGWNDKDFAKKLNYSASYLCRLINHDREPSTSFIEDYLDFTRFDFDQAFIRNGKKPYQKDNYPKFNGKIPYNKWSQQEYLRKE